MFTLSYTTIGEHKAFLVPDEAAERLCFAEGDVVRAIESPAGLLLCRVDQETANQLEIALDVMDRRRDALRRLAE